MFSLTKKRHEEQTNTTTGELPINRIFDKKRKIEVNTRLVELNDRKSNLKLFS